MRYNLYRGKILFHSTCSIDEAFRLFRKWMGAGVSTRIEFEEIV